jgi:hypothetical protein
MLVGKTPGNSNKMQFFRMDYGAFNHSTGSDKGNHDVWQSRTKEFHFHVPRIKGGDV